MRQFRGTWGVTLGAGLILGLVGALPGCGEGGSKTDYKPIETGILKKLGQASQDQSAAAREKLQQKGTARRR